MEIEKFKIDGLLLISPKVFTDSRGYFFESFSQRHFEEITGLSQTFVQDNESKSQKGVLRGLHFQAPPYEQGKLVRVVQGAVLDVAVDLRKNSPSFGAHEKVVLSAENKKQFFVPSGFAHGFLVLQDDTIFSYKCTGFYKGESETSLKWDDPDLAIVWDNSIEPILSDKDRDRSVSWKNFTTPF